MFQNADVGSRIVVIPYLCTDTVWCFWRHPFQFMVFAGEHIANNFRSTSTSNVLQAVQEFEQFSKTMFTNNKTSDWRKQTLKIIFDTSKNGIRYGCMQQLNKCFTRDIEAFLSKKYWIYENCFKVPKCFFDDPLDILRVC